MGVPGWTIGSSAVCPLRVMLARPLHEGLLISGASGSPGLGGGLLLFLYVDVRAPETQNAFYVLADIFASAEENVHAFSPGQGRPA